MNGRRRHGLGLCAATAACAGALLLAPAKAWAAAPVYGDITAGDLPPAKEMELMHEGGVESIRLTAHWGSVEFVPGARDWSSLDSLVLETTARGMRPMVVLYGSPDWVAQVDGRQCARDCSIIAPSSKQTRRAFARFAQDAVARYGPVRWPMQSTCGFSIAVITRLVISSPEVRNEVWTLATTQSSASSRSSS